jgi:hypothetical protein
MESFAVWYYLLVVLPLALEALAGPVLLKQQGLKIVVPALAVLWFAPVALMHYVVGVPEIFHWLLPISEKTWSPSVEALICYALPVWISFLAFLIVARMGKSILVQNIVSAVVSAILLFVVSPNLTAAILRALTGH